MYFMKEHGFLNLKLKMWLFFLVCLPSVDVSVRFGLGELWHGRSEYERRSGARYKTYSVLTEALLLCIVWGAAQ